VLSIWRKRTDGTWEVLRDIWNPAPTPSSAGQ
jgi:ketosteroid isomerase-like protein